MLTKREIDYIQECLEASNGSAEKLIDLLFQYGYAIFPVHTKSDELQRIEAMLHLLEVVDDPVSRMRMADYVAGKTASEI